ncbi:MAG TPA: AMP-binding protein, partial [Euzebyales bacterium]|nr:AMP-binding protein [Euzebyales bacterium]
DAANDFPDNIAVEYRRYRLTYRKLADHADRLATALAALGVGPGAGVALLLPNCPQLVIALFAAWRIGARVSLLTPDDVSALATTDPRVVIVIDRWYARHVAPHRRRLGASTVVATGVGDYLPFPENVLVPVRRLLRRRPVRIPQTEGVSGFADLIRRNVPAGDGPSDAEHLVALTSPQGEITQRQLIVNSFQLRLWLPDVVAGDERVLLGVPLSSTLGAVWIATSVLAAATMILVDDRRATVRQRLAVRARPTLLPIDAELGDQLLRPSRLRTTLSSVRIAVSRDALPAPRRRALEDLTDKGRIRRAWGIGGLLTHADPIYGRYTEGTVGLPLPDTSAVVADPSRPGHPAPAGCRGRLWLRGPQLGAGAWVDSGVDATLDANGYLQVHDAD